LNRLTNVYSSGGNQTFTYDKVGNRLAKTVRVILIIQAQIAFIRTIRAGHMIMIIMAISPTVLMAQVLLMTGIID